MSGAHISHDIYEGARGFAPGDVDGSGEGRPLDQQSPHRDLVAPAAPSVAIHVVVLADRGQGIDLSVAIPAVVLGVTLTLLRRVVVDIWNRRVQSQPGRRRERQRIGCVVAYLLGLSRVSDAH